MSFIGLWKMDMLKRVCSVFRVMALKEGDRMCKRTLSSFYMQRVGEE